MADKSLSGFWSDLRFGARLLRLSPAFTAVAILSLALGIGANTAIFQLLDAVRLRPLPVPRAQELADIRIVKAPNGRTGSFMGRHPQLTFALWETIRREQQAFTSIAAWNLQRINLSRGGEARYATSMFVSGAFFQTIGIQPALGRLISPSDDIKGCGSPGVVISDSFWRRKFGGSTSVLGQTIHLEGYPFEVIGVTPPGFFGLEVGRYFDLALPVCADAIFAAGDEPRAESRQTWWLAAIGRLKPGWTIEKAAAHLEAISPGVFEATLPTEYDAVDRKSYLEMRLGARSAESGLSYLRKEYETPLWLLMAISGLVLLIACANLANLMFARASARQKEMAVRLALGASRGRLIRQLLAESLLLAFIGSLLGAALSQVLSRALVSFLSTQQTQLFLNLHPDWRVLLFTSALAVLTCLLFGLTPAIQASRTTPGEAMKANSRGVTGGSSRLILRRLLVVTQVALSLVLLVGAFLFVRTFQNLLSLDPGFDQENMLVAEFDFAGLKIPVEKRATFSKGILERVRELPGVASAASAWVVPVGGYGWNENINIPGTSMQRKLANFNRVSSGYFRTLGRPLLAGRDFSGADHPSSPRVAIVTETFAKKFLNGANPLGARFSVAQQGGKPDVFYEIVGLVKDVKYSDLREDFTPIVYLSESQAEEPEAGLVLIVRLSQPVAQVIAQIKQVSKDVNPAMILNFNILQTVVRNGLVREKLMATLSGFFGLLAAILAMTGLYGVISYMVVRRRNEIGIRIALGASRRSILSMVLREAGTMLAAGLSIGTFIALVSGYTAQSLLYGLKPTDPLTLTAAVASLSIVAVTASFLPARRAAALDPVQALREE